MISTKGGYEGGTEELRFMRCWNAAFIGPGVHLVALPMIQSQSAIFQVHYIVSSMYVHSVRLSPPYGEFMLFMLIYRTDLRLSLGIALSVASMPETQTS